MDIFLEIIGYKLSLSKESPVVGNPRVPEAAGDARAPSRTCRGLPVHTKLCVSHEDGRVSKSREKLWGGGQPGGTAY